MLLLDPNGRPIIGHRGASGEYPENTLPAFAAALEQGADALELDVRSTADGVPVVLHDATLDRTTNGAGPVATHTLEAVRTLDAGHGAPVPTLAEVLEEFPSVPLLVEVKEPTGAEAVGAVLQRMNARGRVVLGAFEHRTLRRLRRAGFHVAASRRQTAVFWCGAHAGVAVRGRYDVFAVPVTSGHIRVVQDRFVGAATRRGKPVHVWTIDDVQQARRLRDMGVAGIITNFPARMRSL